MISYKQQFDKLTEAYIKMEVNPYIPCACFVGNLLNKSDGWAVGRSFGTLMRSSEDEAGNAVYTRDDTKVGVVLAKICVAQQSEATYSYEDILRLEHRFLHVYEANGGNRSGYDTSLLSRIMFDVPEFGESRRIKNEEALFRAFESTLDLLKEIHQSKGEVIDEAPAFSKRQVVTH